ncbi:MAG TPA: nucleotidyltransferase family protein [Gemmatimonadaceae bacterium]|nr:nucleotidyltransferase family protein [Gemmatimonadaceae bacterium]
MTGRAERAPTVAGLLVALCRRSAPGTAQPPAGARRLDEPAFRAEFVARGEAGRVLGLALHGLARGGAWARLGTEARGALRAAAARLRVRAAAQMMEQDRVLEALATRDVPTVLLKGAALRRTLYAHPEDRHTRDLDLLVPPDRVDAAVAALTAAGYVAPAGGELDAYLRHHFHLQLRHRRGHLVELHWALTEPQSPVRLDAAALLRAAVSVPDDMAGIRVPSVPHLLLHLAAQSATDGTRPLARLVDVDRLVAAAPALDWSALVADARRVGVATALGADLALAARLLDTPVPRAALAALRAGALVRGHLALLQPERFLLPTAPPGATELRLLQLWMLAGDHGIVGALRWLESQGFAGPLGRAASGQAPSERWHRPLLARLKLGAYQLGRYALLPRLARGDGLDPQ